MKRIYSLFIICSFLFVLAGCEKDEIGSTATVKLAGNWYVSTALIDNNGEVIEDDPYGLGVFHLDTYNTAENVPNKIWISDNGEFWDFKGVLDADINSLTFQGENVLNIAYDDSEFTVKNGKILLGAARTPSGAVADSIVFDIKFNDDDPSVNGYRISGYRYTGLVGDDAH